MAGQGTSPKNVKKHSPLQQELMKVIKTRVSKGLGADVSPEEDNDDAMSPDDSDDDEDILTELNNTLRFKKDSRPQPRGAVAGEHSRLVRPGDEDRLSSRRPLPEHGSGPNAAAVKQLPADPANDRIGRRSPLGGRLDAAASTTPKKTVLGEHDSAARMPAHEGPFGTGGHKSPLDRLLSGVGSSGDRRSPILGGLSADVGGKQAPVVERNGRKSPADFPRTEHQKVAVTSASPHRLSPALGGSSNQLRGGARSPAPQLSEASSSLGGSEVSSARQTPRGSEPSTPRLSPLISEKKTSKGGELTMKQKEDIIFGRSGGPGDAKKAGAAEKSAGSKLASILGIGDSRKSPVQSKSPKSELDALLADEKPPKEETKVWKPPQFKSTSSSSTLNEEGRKSPRQQDGKLPESGDSDARKEAAPKPKPRTSTAQTGQEKPSDNTMASDRPGRLTPSSLARHEADSDDDRDHVSQKTRKGALIRDIGGKNDADGKKSGSAASSGRSTPAADVKDDSKARKKAAESPTSHAFATSHAFDASARKLASPPIAPERQDRLTRKAEFEYGSDNSAAFRRTRPSDEASSKPTSKKSYLQSLLGTDAGEHDEDDSADEAVTAQKAGAESAGSSYLSRLLQQSPAAADASGDNATKRRQLQPSRDKLQAESAGSKWQPPSAGKADDDRARTEERLTRRRVALDEHRQDDDSSVCFDVEKDPSQLARQKAERDAKLRRFGKGRLTEKQENDLHIDDVADAQSSALLRPIEPAAADCASATAGDGSSKKQPVKPKACYATTSGGDSPASSMLSRSFESTSDIRQFIYDEWTRAKSAQARKEHKQRVLKEKEEEEKKQKETAEKMSSSKASYDSWKETKAKAKAEAAKARKDEERKKKEEEKAKTEAKATAELAFRRWKEEKDDKIKADLKKVLKEKREQEKTAKEEQKNKEKDRTTAFTGWKSKKDEHLKQASTEEEKRRREVLEKQRREQAESEKKAEDTYREWIHKKEEQKEEERRQRRIRKLQELENPRPAWSPPNKTVPHVR